MAEQEVLLEVRDLCKNFKVRSRKIGESAQLLHALSHVNLKVYRGETLGVIGESGCGKSTLGRCIVGLHTPSSGQLVFEGKPLNFKAGGGQGKALRRKIQMIFQDPYSSLDPRKTCGKIVEGPMIIHKTVTDSAQRQERVRELMSVVGLDAQHVHRFPHEFSGGQRQRINITRALSLNPDLLVCDEPVSALDVSIQAQVLNLFGRLQEEFGLTYASSNTSATGSPSCTWVRWWSCAAPRGSTTIRSTPTPGRSSSPCRPRAPLRRRRPLSSRATSPVPSGTRWVVRWPPGAPTAPTGAGRSAPR